ncbi:NAD(P)H-quinone oxidoreductase [Paraburkholderia antibiotica]|nr:NAD(P)H-quinone oxidoreductase [Paraburkholderia antibiotica]
MYAVEIENAGRNGKLKLTRRPTPSMGDRDVLIEVHGAGVNRPDVLQRRGYYPPPPGASDLPGLEVGGVVVAIGKRVSRFACGDRVCALLAGGGYAEYVSVHEGHVLPAPAGLSLIEAASLPETVFTVWANMVTRGQCKAGDTVLVHGGTSGIGVTAIQIATALGASVIATAGSKEKATACEKLGAKLGVNYREEDFVASVLEVTDGRGADVILDIVGGEYVERNLRAAATNGRVVSIAFIGGVKGEVDLNLVMKKRLLLTGSTLRSALVEEKSELASEVMHHVWPMFDANTLRPVVHKVFPLGEAQLAHELMERSEHIGKIVLDVRSARA